MEVPYLYYRSCQTCLMGSGWFEGRTIRRTLSPGDLGPSSPGSGLTGLQGRKFTQILTVHAAFTLKVARPPTAVYVSSL